MLYHYTSLGSFIKIVETRRLWASSILYLNDGREFAHAVELLNECLEQLRKADPDTDAFVTEISDEVSFHAKVPVFAASFSEKGDLLSQWRAYCPPARGISIGVGKAALRKACSQQGFSLERCIYDRKDQFAILEDLLARYSKEYKGSPSDPDIRVEEECERIVAQFTSAFLREASRMKDPAFSEEREWRVVTTASIFPRGERKYRDGKSFVVPYVEFNLPVERDGALKLGPIIVGPTPNPDLSVSSADCMLRDSGVKFGGVTSSTVPHRPW